MSNASSRSQFSVEVPADVLHVIVSSDDTWDHVVCLLDMVVSVNTWRHLHAEQSGWLLFDRYRCCNDTLADAFGPIHFVSPPAVHDDPDTVFVFKLASSHHGVSLIRLPDSASIFLRPTSHPTLSPALH